MTSPIPADGLVMWTLPNLYLGSGVTGEASFGGTAEGVVTPLAAPPIMGGINDNFEVPLQLSILPAAPATFVANASDADIDAPAAGGAGCTIDTISVAALSWTATAVGASFGWYELQRLGFDGVTWETVAKITTESLVSFVDWEVRRGQRERYRARVVRDTDYVGSAWTAVDDCAIGDAGEDVVFASNHAQDALAFVRDPDHSFTFPTNTEHLELSGRDYRVALVESEDRGDEFEIPVVVFAGDDDAPSPTIPGRMVFEPLRAFCRLDVPHFAVCDRDGWRWFGSLTLTEAEREEPASNYRATVEFVEGQSAPTPVEAS